jgi:hypothetical protein
VSAAHEPSCNNNSTRSGSGYRARQPHKSALYQVLRDNLETFFACYAHRYQSHYGYLRKEVRRTLEEMLQCGCYEFGMARVKCTSCDEQQMVPLSCRWRGVCNSCQHKRSLAFCDFMLEEVVPDVPVRQFVFSLPKALRRFFAFDGSLYRQLSQLVIGEITRYMRSVTGHPDLEPGLCCWDQSFGTRLDGYHPHQHIVATDGGFLPDGTFVCMPRMRNRDIAALCEVLRHRVIAWLQRKDKISAEFAQCIGSWAHSGFSLDARRRLRAGRRKRFGDLLRYVSRHPFDPWGIRYNKTTRTVRYRAKRRHATRNTDVIEVDAVDFIAIIAQHIPHARRHQVRYYGAANAKVRKRLGLTGRPTRGIPAATAARGRRSWARLIWKIYGIDPLICPRCGGQRVILAVILDRDAITRIIDHLQLRRALPASQPARAPPHGPLPVADPVASSRGQPAAHDESFPIDPDTSEFDAMDEPFATDATADLAEDLDGPQPAPRVRPSQLLVRPKPLDEQTKRQHILAVINRWPGKLGWAG